MTVRKSKEKEWGEKKMTTWAVLLTLFFFFNPILDYRMVAVLEAGSASAVPASVEVA